ncbi:unnamed protein product [Hydatigera taeniaeformis]|uniref:OTU domain-containing protein n=1 Tax=Hydatigena taeniaeformis TaxID=6205 RepID=A0A0R3X098_HYDTA|nr:unnamed protein product [Hydatigera taeniaeformis]
MEEEVISRHRKEKKELQAKIQSLKKSVPKGDRSRRIAVQQEILALEKQLAGRQAEELRQLNFSLDALSIDTPDLSLSKEGGEAPLPRVSKAAKRRKKAAAKAQSLSKAVDESLAKNVSSTSALEYSQLERALFERGLTLHKVSRLLGEYVVDGSHLHQLLTGLLIVLKVPSDGDCLFASVAHQLEVLDLTDCLVEACKKFSVALPASGDVKSTVRCLRLLASAVIRQNEEDYLPFICSDSDLACNSATGRLRSKKSLLVDLFVLEYFFFVIQFFFSSAKVDLYCKNLEAPGTWGGQLEIQALSTALKRPIEVLHIAGPVIRSGEIFSTSCYPPSPLVIT